MRRTDGDVRREVPRAPGGKAHAWSRAVSIEADVLPAGIDATASGATLACADCRMTGAVVVSCWHTCVAPTCAEAVRPECSWQPAGCADAGPQAMRQSTPPNGKVLMASATVKAMVRAISLMRRSIGQFGWRRTARSSPGQRAARLSRSALPITETELTLMAAAAIIGESRRPKNG